MATKKDKKLTAEIDQPAVCVEKRKLSEIKKEYSELETLLKESHTEYYEKKYPVEFKTAKGFNDMLKYIRFEAKWNMNNMALLIVLNHEMSQFVPKKGEKGSVVAELSYNAVVALWTVSQEYSGIGAVNAKGWFDVFNSFRESCRAAMDKIKEGSEKMQKAYERMAELDGEAANPDKFIDDTVKEQPATDEEGCNDCDKNANAAEKESEK